jgi:hypothetical protein
MSNKENKRKQTIVALTSAAVALGSVGIQSAKPAPPGVFDMDGMCTMKGGDVKFNLPTDPEDILTSERKNRYDLPEQEDDSAFLAGSIPFGSNDDANAATAWDRITGLMVNDGHKKPNSGEDTSAQGKAFRIRGYILDVELGGIETCNCKQTIPEHMDVHIFLARDSSIMKLDKKLRKGQCIVAEVSPRVRRELGHDDLWSYKNLSKSIVGKNVEFEGWLFYDYEHFDNGTNERTKNHISDKSVVWRRTCWEVHPITSIKLVGDDGVARELAPVSSSTLPATTGSTAGGGKTTSAGGTGGT